MNKEQLFQLFILIGLILLVLISYLIGVVLGQFYMIVFFFIIFLGCFFVFILLYLRIQHNIDRKAYFVGKKIDEQRKVNKDIVSFFESFLKVLEEQKRSNDVLVNFMSEQKRMNEDISGLFENLINALNEDKEKSDEYKNKIVVLIEQILDYQKDQTDFLKDKMGKFKDVKRKRR